MRQAQIEDWIEDLHEFDLDVIAEACASWRRVGTKRPTIADIRLLCVRERDDRALPQQPALDTPEQRDAYARSVGFHSWGEREAALERQRERFARAEAWRRTNGAAA